MRGLNGVEEEVDLRKRRQCLISLRVDMIHVSDHKFGASCIEAYRMPSVIPPSKQLGLPKSTEDALL